MQTIAEMVAAHTPMPRPRRDPRKARMPLGELLIRTGALSPPRLKAALSHQERFGGRLGEILVDDRAVTEDDLARALSSQLKIPTVDLDRVEIDPQLLELLPRKLMWDKRIIPVRLRGKFLDVAVSTTSDLKVVEEARALTGLNIREHLTTWGVMKRLMEKHLGRGGRGIPIVPENEARNLSLRREAEFHREKTAMNDVTELRKRLAQYQARAVRDQATITKLIDLCLASGYTREQINTCFY